MGAVLGGLGLKAVCVRARAGRATRPREAALLETLARSPRLAERSRGGTLELFSSAAARGLAERGAGEALAVEAGERAAEQHGCRGCPTPCGWVFERSDGTRQGARFGASHALGLALGFESLDEALFLLAACDRLGIDAKRSARRWR
jgi:aldehyde:ferredoxin oxidoreductase